MQFYISDYIKDTRILTLEERGAWVDILCVLWESPTRGKKTMKLADWAQHLSASNEHAELLIGEIKRKQIAVVLQKNENITIQNRRMLRDQKARKLSQVRMVTHRLRSGYASVTPNMSYIRSHKQQEAPLVPQFVAPTRDQVKAYAEEIKYDLDADRFIAYYEGQGWKRNGKPLTNWKLAVCTWKKKDGAASRNKKDMDKLLDGLGKDMG